MEDDLPEVTRSNVDLLIPVPVSSEKMRSRGYNQSELLAKHISNQLNLPLDTTTLHRTHEALPQAKTASIEERAENVKHAFAVTGEFSGKRVLLIDDVMTTGSTLNACSEALKSAGAAWVGALVLAREL